MGMQRHARRKKHVVKLYCCVAHAQCNATRMTNMRSREELGKEQRACRGLERDREPARQGRQRQRELEKERASEREKTMAGR